MSASKAGWHPKDLEKLYVGFGFVYRDKGKHRVYTHPSYPELIATVTRGNKLAVGYIQTALKLLGRLDQLRGTTQLSEGDRP
jgi:predicted RNA binding protein YcfA (HicA-like mRNA interferase family)